MTSDYPDSSDIYKNLSGKVEVYRRDVPDNQNRLVPCLEIRASVFCTYDRPKKDVETFISDLMSSGIHASPSLADPSLPQHGIDDGIMDRGSDFSRKRAP